MHSRRTAWVLACACLATAACGTASRASSEGPGGAELAAVIAAVKGALVESQASEVPGFPPLKSVSVKLQTTARRGVGGEIHLVVFSLGASVESEAASTIELDLKPPEPPRRRGLLSEDVRESLAKAIAAAKQAVASASVGEPPLAVKSVQIELRFAVATDGSAGGAVRLVPVGLEASGKISRDRVHTIVLGFAP